MESLRDAKKKCAAANKGILEFIGGFIDSKSFVETDALMHSATDAFDAPGEGVVCGFAAVDGVNVCVFALNPDVLKGSIGALNAKKITRTVNNAVRTDKPLIAVWDTAGARFTEGIDCLEGYGSILRAFSVAYGEVPIISIIKGNDLGLAAYVTGISDFVIACDGACVATASPLVISAKTGVKQAAVGTKDVLLERGIATNDGKKDLKATITKILSVFNGGTEYGDDVNRVCKGLKAGVSADALIKEVFDKNSFLPVREKFAPEIKTGFAALGDIVVGVVATDGKINDGRITADGCVKIGEFLNICENAECPVIFLTDSVGTDITSDDARLIREMSDLIYHINSVETDTFAVVYGKAIGSAYTALVDNCEYKIAWDCASVGALESEAAARLVYADDIKSAKNKDAAAKLLAEKYSDENCSAVTLAKSGHFDNVIEPDHTRSYLLAALVAHME